MGIFKRRKADEAFKIQLEREAIDKMNRHDEDDYMLPLELAGNDSVWNINGKTIAPSAITAEELMGTPEKASIAPSPDTDASVQKIPMSNSTGANQSSLDFLYKRMTEARNQSLENTIVGIQKNDDRENTAPSEAVDSSAPITTIHNEAAPVNEQPTPTVTAVCKTSPRQKVDSSAVIPPDPKAEPTASYSSEPLDFESLFRSLKEEYAPKKADDAVKPTKISAEPINKATFEQSQPEKSLDPQESNKSDSFGSDDENSKTNIFISLNNAADQKITDNDTKSTHTEIPPAVDPQKARQTEERRTSLLARCNAYLEDEEFGAAKLDTEKYKLESVESILQDFEARASQRVMKNLNRSTKVSSTAPFDAVKTSKPSTTPPVSAEPPKNEDISKTTAFVIGADAKPEVKTDPQPVKHYFTAPARPANKPDNTVTDDKTATRIMTDAEIEKIAMETTAADDKTSIFAALQLPKEATSESDTVEPTDNSRSAEDNAYPDDYKSVNDRKRVMDMLLAARKKHSVRALLSLLLLIPAICLITPLSASIKEISVLLYYGIDLGLCLISILINLDIFKSLASLFSKKSDTNLPAALASISVLIYSVAAMLLKSNTVSLCSVSLLSLLFNSLSNRSFFTGAINNFELIANSDTKKAVAIIKSKSATNAMVGNSIEGGSLICCGANATNIKNFLKYTYCNDPVAGKIKNISIIGLIFSIIILIAALIASKGDIISGLLAFSAALCITAAPSTLFISHLPFKIAHGRLRLYDAMLTGYRAADELDLCNGVAVSCSDLFPEGSIRLVDMKLLSPNPIDQSMLDAAALADAIGSPIAGIFRQVSAASSYKQAPLKVDSFVYENKMGISGWVDDRRVFVGNRDLMVAHGFSSLPPAELDKKILRKGYFPVYLVSDNVPCALLVVKYAPDEEIAYELRRLCNTGTTILVHNCDPNISNQMLCDYFGLYSETISVMSKQGSEAYEAVIKPRNEIVAGAAYNSSVCGLFATLTAAINVKRSIIGMSVIYVISVILGLLALGAALFTSSFSYVSAISLLVFQLVTTLITFLPPLLKRP